MQPVLTCGALVAFLLKCTIVGMSPMSLLFLFIKGIAPLLVLVPEKSSLQSQCYFDWWVNEKIHCMWNPVDFSLHTISWWLRWKIHWTREAPLHLHWSGRSCIARDRFCSCIFKFCATKNTVFNNQFQVSMQVALRQPFFIQASFSSLLQQLSFSLSSSGFNAI